MAPGALVGATGYMNAVYCALTVPALCGVARRLGGATAAKAALLLYLASPMLMAGAATELAHTSCMMALAWSAWCYLLARERPSAWWLHAGVAIFFGLAVLIRPTSALGVGVPILVAWLFAASRQAPAPVRVRALAAFAISAAVMAAVFFAVNDAQNGSPLVSAYSRMQAYMREVNYVNVGWSADNPPTSLSAFMLPNRHVGTALGTTTVALVRLLFDLLGSPLIVLFLVPAWGVRPARLAWWSAISFVCVHFFMGESGVDSFGPVHFYEMSLPVLLLAGVGFARLSELAAPWPHFRRWPAAVAASLVLVSLAGFVPVRFAALKRIADSINTPADAVRRAHLSRAVIFTAGLVVPQPCVGPTHGFAYFRPNNDPGLTNDILWVNHLGWDVDHDLMRYFPGRTGYLLQWDGCVPRFIRL